VTPKNPKKGAEVGQVSLDDMAFPKKIKFLQCSHSNDKIEHLLVKRDLFVFDGMINRVAVVIFLCGFSISRVFVFSIFLKLLNLF
jgi:hypothetical protein